MVPLMCLHMSGKIVFVCRSVVAGSALQYLSTPTNNRMRAQRWCAGILLATLLALESG